jgi:hypothetical protein
LAFSEYRERFYQANRKIVPIELLREQLTGLGLAIWLMDDGSADGEGVRLNTQSFSETENEALAAISTDYVRIGCSIEPGQERFSAAHSCWKQVTARRGHQAIHASEYVMQTLPVTTSRMVREMGALPATANLSRP